MRIVVALPQIGARVEQALDAARAAEEAGAWGVSVLDHAEAPAAPARSLLDGWALLGPVARVTSRVRLVSLVTRAGLRPPAVVTRMAAVVHAASAGRFVLGVGVGDERSLPEERRFGTATARTRAERLDAALALVGGDDAPVRPVVQRPPVWIGGLASDVLELASARADAWHGWGITPAAFGERARRVRDAADRPVECWWGGFFVADDAVRTLEALRASGADGVTWTVRSADEPHARERLLAIVRDQNVSS